jgi:hypothetical protein
MAVVLRPGFNVLYSTTELNEIYFILSDYIGINTNKRQLYDHLLLQERSNGRNEKTI